MTPRRRPDEAGTTLIELLVTVAIMGIALVFVVEGMGTAIIGTDIQKQQVGAGVIVRTAAEAILDENTDYKACATVATTTYADSLPTGASITAVSYWYEDRNQFEPEQPATCPGTDTGLQLITLSATSTGGGRPATETLEVVKRR